MHYIHLCSTALHACEANKHLSDYLPEFSSNLLIPFRGLQRRSDFIFKLNKEIDLAPQGPVIVRIMRNLWLILFLNCS